MSHSDVDEDEVKHEAGKTKPRHFVHIDCSGLVCDSNKECYYY